MEDTMENLKRYVSAETMTNDDFEVPFTHEIGEVIYDAKTIYGSWATMTQKSFDKYAHQFARGNLCTGRGQKYVRNAEGHLVLTEGGST